MQIQRPMYLKQLIDHHGDGFVKIVTGIRRCGKSYLLDPIFRGWLRDQGVQNDQIMSISLDRISDLEFRNPLRLAERAREFASHRSEPCYLFVDEIQMSDTAENPFSTSGAPITFYDALNDLRAVPNLDIYVTGSNSRMLSSDILSEFRGRGFQIRLHPLTFAEYCSCADPDNPDTFEKYAYFGGMPALLSLPDDQSRMQYLKSLFSEVYLKDIVERGHLQREDVLSELVDVLCSAVGSLTNPTKISNAVRSRRKDSVSENTIRSYLKQLEDAFLFSESRRYDVRGRSYFEYPGKFYCEDIGLRNARLNFRQQEPTHIMENILYNDLRARGFDVDVGVVYAYQRSQRGNSVRIPTEIDFVANGPTERIYIQSAHALSTEEKRGAEIRPLLHTGDSFSKIIVERDVGLPWCDDYGVRHIGLTDFLLNPNIMR